MKTNSEFFKKYSWIKEVETVPESFGVGIYTMVWQQCDSTKNEKENNLLSVINGNQLFDKALTLIKDCA